MGSTVFNVAVDCADPDRLARFWSNVVGRPLADDDHPGDPVATVKLPGGPTLYFEHVPEQKTGVGSCSPTRKATGSASFGS